MHGMRLELYGLIGLFAFAFLAPIGLASYLLLWGWVYWIRKREKAQKEPK